MTLNIRPDRERVYLGETFNLYVEVIGADAGLSPPDISGLPPAETSLLSSSSNSRRSIQIVNGRVTQEVFESRIFVFAVKPRQDGLFETGPVRIVHNGRSHVGKGVDVTVTGIQQQETVVARIRSSGENLMVDEPFTITLTVSIAALPEPYAHVEPLVADSPPNLQADYLALRDIHGLDSPDIKASLDGLIARDRRLPGFTINDYRESQAGFFANPFDVFTGHMQPRLIKFRLTSKRLANADRNYWEYTLSLTYTPRQEGDYTFGPLTFKGPVIIGGDRQNRAITKDIFAIAPAVTVRVAPPPEQGRPDWFVGGVGRDLTVQASFDTDVCKVGDPLTLTLDLTGSISLTNLRPPPLSLQPGVTADFRVYDDNIESIPLNNGRRFRYRVRPLRAGTLEFPAIKAAFFDTELRQYRTVTSVPIPVQVRATTQIVSDAPDASGIDLDLRAQRLVAVALRPPSAITVSPQALEPDPLLPPMMFLGVPLAIGPIGYLLALGGAWLWARRQAFADRWRVAQARSRAVRALNCRAVRTPRDIAAVLRMFMAHRLNAPAHALTPDETARLLRGHGAPEEMVASGLDLLIRLDEANYRQDFSGDPTAYVRPAIGWIKEVDAALRRKEHPSRRSTLRLFLLAALLAGAGTARAPDDATRGFLWDQANARMAGARLPADYLEAARAYNRLVAMRADSGLVFFNLGTALLLAGDASNAVAALERAERRMGLTPAIRNNLRQALAMRSGQPNADLPWTRTAFFWHFDFPCRMRAHLAAAGWVLFWLALTARHLSRNRPHRVWRVWTGAGRIAGLALLVVFGASVAISIAMDRHDRRTWPERERLFAARDAAREEMP